MVQTATELRCSRAGAPREGLLHLRGLCPGEGVASREARWEAVREKLPGPRDSLTGGRDFSQWPEESGAVGGPWDPSSPGMAPRLAEKRWLVPGTLTRGCFCATQWKWGVRGKTLRYLCSLYSSNIKSFFLFNVEDFWSISPPSNRHPKNLLINHYYSLIGVRHHCTCN